MSKIALDLCCGKGGWAGGLLKAGWRVIGVDNWDFSKTYPGEFVLADLLTWEDWREIDSSLVVSSPPCEQYSRWSMPWTRAKNPPPPNHELWFRCLLIGRSLKVPTIIENVRGAQHFHGRSAGNCGPFHLWGDVPAILPVFGGKKKESYGSKQKADRAIIPLELAYHVGRSFL